MTVSGQDVTTGKGHEMDDIQRTLDITLKAQTLRSLANELVADIGGLARSYGYADNPGIGPLADQAATIYQQACSLQTQRVMSALRGQLQKATPDDTRICKHCGKRFRHEGSAEVFCF